MQNKFNTLDEFYDNLKRGGEIEFRYKGKEYCITQPEGKISIMEKYNYETEKLYEDIEEVGEYIIEDKKLKEIVSNIEIIFRCF
ncbi:hypothetical protein Y919_08890 [Caloranaerobacter azorensis H53214]|uniref:Uncharacterized protein n=1 Tax=Caloranaerobacter azorensis H53214 TaxID=1156417 RepID=A0A096BGR8_9FIRM|nr:hypothetical protein [Caloranaerobacter azorensis]KGG79953.1 hypothetical protein Y919_08890 [Caloranaerobacter azorensis H53214]